MQVFMNAFYCNYDLFLQKHKLFELSLKGNKCILFKRLPFFIFQNKTSEMINDRTGKRLYFFFTLKACLKRRLVTYCNLTMSHYMAKTSSIDPVSQIYYSK
jgi:hypothetical protein